MSTKCSAKLAWIVDSSGRPFTGGGGSLAHKLATHPCPSTSKMNPKWRIVPCNILYQSNGVRPAKKNTLNGVKPAKINLNGVRPAKNNPKWRILQCYDTEKAYPKTAFWTLFLRILLRGTPKVRWRMKKHLLGFKEFTSTTSVIGWKAYYFRRFFWTRVRSQS